MVKNLIMYPSVRKLVGFRISLGVLMYNRYCLGEGDSTLEGVAESACCHAY
jgi:hypothetical protein